MHIVLICIDCCSKDRNAYIGVPLEDAVSQKIQPIQRHKLKLTIMFKSEIRAMALPNFSTSNFIFPVEKRVKSTYLIELLNRAVLLVRYKIACKTAKLYINLNQ